ncbi:hypothetical protein BC940DRAFT_130672 [Gongronella butleri]|nr:hypothetical protein BC940DRAFT_130672 [Gongronella butleri]
MQSTRPRPPPPPPPRQARPAPPLPPGWAEYYAQGGRPYWYNAATGVTTWERPLVRPAPPPPPPRSQPQEQPKKKLPRKRIPGTRWLLVSTHDGIDFYYNKDTKSSVWEMPPELDEPLRAMRDAERKHHAPQHVDVPPAKRTKIESDQLHAQDAPRAKDAPQTTDDAPPASHDAPETPTSAETAAPPVTDAPASAESKAQEATEMTEEDLQWQLENMDPEELAELGLLPEASDNEDTTENQEKSQDDDEMPSNDKAPAEPEASDEEKIEAFMMMLHEKQISPFSSWEKELPKLIADGRYNAVQPHSKRKQLFNNFCHAMAEEHREKKQAAQKQQLPPEAQFKEMLLDLVPSKMYWDDFKRKARNDPRFLAVRESRARETLFKDHVRALSAKAASHSSKSSKSSAKSRASPQDEYMALLKETKLYPGMRWRDAKRLLDGDDRYHAISSKDLREDLFRDYLDTL